MMAVSISRPAAATDRLAHHVLFVAVEAPRAVGPAAREPEQAERQRVATAMVYVVIGIAIVGVALIVLIILGGHRIRHRSRTRTPRGADLDPLWYLRHNARSEPTGNPPGDRPPGAGPVEPEGS
jgi:hypothetical protein